MFLCLSCVSVVLMVAIGIVFLLQEKNTTSWLNILLQILLVLASIAAVFYLWPVLAAIFAGTFVGIYQ